MERKILVIGSEGFIGKSFTKYYLKHYNSDTELFMVDILNIKKNNYFLCNATNFEKINAIIQKIEPNEIFNFSGTFTNQFEIDYLNNVIITKNIFDSLIFNNNINCKILINGSAAEYGYIKEYDKPINEDFILNPISFYGLSKVYQTYLAKTYFFKNFIKVFIARPFNIIGYGVSDKLFIGKLINEIRVNLEKKSKIRLGNLDNERDYIDIKDVIIAYEKIMNNGLPGEIYNIGSSISIKIQDLLNLFLKTFGIKESEVEKNISITNKYDVPKIIADISKLKAINWKPQISLEKSVHKIKKKMFND